MSLAILIRILQAIGVNLQFIIPPAFVPQVVSPFRGIRRGVPRTVKFVTPHQFPSDLRRCLLSKHSGWQSHHQEEENRTSQANSRIKPGHVYCPRYLGRIHGETFPCHPCLITLSTHSGSVGPAPLIPASLIRSRTNQGSFDSKSSQPLLLTGPAFVPPDLLITIPAKIQRANAEYSW